MAGLRFADLPRCACAFLELARSNRIGSIRVQAARALWAGFLRLWRLWETVVKAQWFKLGILTALLYMAGTSPSWGQAKPAAPPAAKPSGAASARIATPAAAPVAVWQDDAKGFVQGLLIELAAPGKDASLSSQQKAKALESVLAKNLAVQRMGAILLGNNRTIATPAQLEEYNRLVPAYVAHTFAERIDELVAQNLKMGATSARSAREVIVSTGFARKNNQGDVKVNWRTIKAGSGPIQVLDVSVNGVSPLIVQREEFTTIVKQKGFDGLLMRLRSTAG